MTDKDGVAIPDAQIELTPTGDSQHANGIASDEDGRFVFPAIANGEYYITIRSKYFWVAFQEFTVIHARQGESKCTQPIRVVLKPAGQCSYVENGWPELKTK